MKEEISELENQLKDLQEKVKLETDVETRITLLIQCGVYQDIILFFLNKQLARLGKIKSQSHP
jgi:hypothetical protein